MPRMVNGWLFCTLMLPVTNYRFRKSMQLPIIPSKLYQAYPQTVGRDIAYGWARGYFFGVLKSAFAGIAFFQGSTGKAVMFGLTVLIACIVSSPFNEWRGYS